MRKKHKIYQSPTVKIEALPKAFVTSISVSNLQEQKARFLQHGKTPVFVVEGDTDAVEQLASKTSGRIRFDLLGEAEYILNTVKQKYGKGENYLEHIYGPRIDQKEANEILFDYIRENSLQESLAVYWSNDMPCSARMVWKGYAFKCNRPEARSYALWLNGSRENPYLRRHGLRCLLDHEIGTHFYRSYNDGLQPWFYDRKKFGLRGAGSFESMCTEEGLASINTTLRAKEKYLWLSALTYYTACKSTEMTFKQLFDHLGQFLDNPEQRWKHVMRVKRGLLDPNDLGGYGKDQCYFEGAVAILRNLDNINFQLLMSGKICHDEVQRVKRLARLGSICLPTIMKDMEAYRKQLKKMAGANGLHLAHPSHQPSTAYVQRLKERQAGVRRKRKVRKGKKLRRMPSKVLSTKEDEDRKSCDSDRVASLCSDDSGLCRGGSEIAVGGESLKVRNASGSLNGGPGTSFGSPPLSNLHHDPQGSGVSGGSKVNQGSSASAPTSSKKTSGGQKVETFALPAWVNHRPHTATAGVPSSRLPPLLPKSSPDKESNENWLCVHDSGASSPGGFYDNEGPLAVTIGGGFCGNSTSPSFMEEEEEEEGGPSWLVSPPPSLPPLSPPSTTPISTLPFLSQGEGGRGVGS